MHTAVIDSADWLLAVPIKAAAGQGVDFSGTPLSVAFAPAFGGEPVATAQSSDGSLVFVPAAGSVPAHFTIDLPVTDRTWRTDAPVTVVGDILRTPQAGHTEWLGRVAFVVHPGSASGSVARIGHGPVLLPAQPYDGRVSSAPLIVGPQGAPATGNGLPPLPPDAASKTYTLAAVSGVLAWVAAGSIGPDPTPGDLAPRLSLADPRNLLALRPLGLA